MGAFFLYKDHQGIDLNRAKDIYVKKGFASPQVFRLGEYKLYLYKKQLLDTGNYFQADNFSVYAVGSLFYKGMGYRQSLVSLLFDYRTQNIEKEDLFGNYVLIFFDEDEGKADFFIDPACIKNVYFDKQNQSISTDFLALVAARKDGYSINKPAIIENMITGNLISPDTYVNEIEKLDKANLNALNGWFKGIRFKSLKSDLLDQIQTRADAIAHANQMLENYFKGVSAISNEFGAHIGLTGGFDSRLLLMHARKQIEKLNTNSFWRPNSQEYINAKELAKVSGLDFFSYEKQPFQVPAKDEMIDELMFVHDGQVRSQNRWDEEFAQKAYTAAVSNSHFVGFHGCGGEQYRNADRFLGKMSVRSFILYEWMFKQCRDPFTDKKLKQEVFENIKRKMFRLLGDLGSKIGLFELKRIQNEIWNTANRATRPNILNRQQFYFAPFTEYIISQYAYRYVPFLGRSLSFQIDMMRTIDSELAAVKTNYGFSLVDGEPLKNKVVSNMSGMIPRKLMLQLYQKIKQPSASPPAVSYTEGEMHPLLNELRKSVDFDVLIRNVNLSPGVYAFNHLLKNI